MLQGNETGEQGVEALAQVVSGTAAAGVDASRLSLDVSIARGLDYYTGTVIETFLNELPQDRECVFRRPIRRFGERLHKAAIARNRCLAGTRPPVGRDG